MPNANAQPNRREPRNTADTPWASPTETLGGTDAARGQPQPDGVPGQLHAWFPTRNEDRGSRP
eukprot:7954166-Lingulodinium_polyedra.AAC.1